MFQLEKCWLMAPNIKALDYKIADPPEERSAKVFVGFQSNNKDTEDTLVVVVLVNFSLALDLSEINRGFKQITMATSTAAVVDAESWEEYVTVARQISTLSKWHPSNGYGVSCSLSFAAMTSFRETRDFIVVSYEQGLISDIGVSIIQL